MVTMADVAREARVSVATVSRLLNNQGTVSPETAARVQGVPPPHEPAVRPAAAEPRAPGGDAALLKYIGENTIYPEIAKENNIQGRVIVRFCVTAKGGVSQVSVLKGVDPELDKEAIRVVNTLPPFKPGKQGGKPVPVWYMVPITFTLK